MKRTTSAAAFSLTSVLTAVLLLGLLAWYASRGNLLFSPGALSAQTQTAVTLQGFSSHADFEIQCVQCHQPLAKPMSTLCFECHTEIQTQIQTNGLHNRLPQAQQCTTCHLEHRGRDFNPSDSARQNFDHNLATFSLLHHAVDYTASPMPCQACHSGANFVLDPAACAQCHANHNPTFAAQHRANFGDDCLQCHDGLDRFTGFHHAQTLFPLTGKHAGAVCANCHPSARQPEDFTAAPTECYACHQADDTHDGEFGTTCQTCHTPDSWQNATFDHAKTTFPLQGLHTNVECKACHTAGYAGTPRACAACHIQDDAHAGRFGTACETCHTPNGWKPATFDHALAAFALTGAHQTVACEQCHVNNVFRGTPQQCAACHAEPTFHLGAFTSACETCHTTDAWQPARFEQPHTFPMNHGESGWNTCKTCHLQNVSTYTCYGCHEHNQAEIEREHREEGITNVANCARCHPTGREDEGDDD